MDIWINSSSCCTCYTSPKYTLRRGSQKKIQAKNKEIDTRRDSVLGEQWDIRESYEK